MTLRHAVVVGLMIVGLATTAGANARSERASTAARSRPAAASRTLDDIHIEGEIPVPQVLFITTRDQRRFLEFQHLRYLRTSQKLGEDFGLPTWIVVTRTGPALERRHTDE